MAHDSNHGPKFKMKVSATLSAKKLLSELKEVHGKIFYFINQEGVAMVVHQMCFPAKEYMVGNSDVKLGEIDGTPFYINEEQYEKWKHTDLTIDAVKGNWGHVFTG